MNHMGQNRRIALVVVSIFVISLLSVLFVLGKDYFPNSADDLKIDILGTISHHNEVESYREVLENSKDPIFAIEPDGILSYLSPGLESTLGYKPGELEGKLIFPIIHEKDLPEIITELAGLLQHGEAIKSAGPFRIIVKDGDFRYMLLSAVPFKDSHGIVSRVVGSFKDITDSIKEFKEDKEEKTEMKDDGPKIRDIDEKPDEDEHRLVVESLG